ncbi:hypothetical protein FHW84_000749 [Dyella sp. SG562]|uniref:hypothetical protein n=1 Tax=Dyella TaxID=231454 RepID=UPI00141FE9D0|nr:MULTISPECIES: hypothetical protein [unclassified Dyella]NII72183.1 hypothetical protein [Dyella sp. SG562]NKJ22615.1 hypothetical protein [Dyella sp. SG609]
MAFKLVALIMAIYILSQHAFTIFVARRMSRYDPNYFKDVDFSSLGIRLSFRLTRMLFDPHLPAENYSAGMKGLLLAARIVYAGIIPLFVVLMTI